MKQNNNANDLDLGKDFLKELKLEINLISRISFQKLYCLIKLKIVYFKITLKALIDSDVNQNCI